MSHPELVSRVEKDPVQVRLSGAGGQGLITAGIILAEAALLDGKNVVQTQSYGPEARLGASKSEVILSKKKIAYPQVTKPDWLLCLSQDSFAKYFSQVDSGTVVVVDSSNVERVASDSHRIYGFPITETATKVGSKVVANVVALGVINALAGFTTPGSLREAVARRVPERFRALNLQALEAGEQLVEQAVAQGSQALTKS